jgi:hypothetical protein
MDITYEETMVSLKFTSGTFEDDEEEGVLPMFKLPIPREGRTLDAAGTEDMSTATLKLSLLADIACDAAFASGPPLLTYCSIDFSVFLAISTGSPCIAPSRDFAARTNNSC